MSDYQKPIDRMIKSDIVGRGVIDQRVIDIMRRVPRHRFIADWQAANAYDDRPLFIDCGQTISQPYMVAAMTEALKVEPGHKALEIGTGSGYQSAVLAELGAEVYTIERIGSLLNKARETLGELGYKTIHFHEGDGTLGWSEKAPFDRIIVTAAGPDIPPPLLAQLSPDGGILIIPAGDKNNQTLWQVIRNGETITRNRLFDCRFVPLVGQAGYPQ